MTVPSSRWTVGCCAKGGVAVGSFAVFVCLHEVIEKDITSGKLRKVELPPVFLGCMNYANEVTFKFSRTKRRRED